MKQAMTPEDFEYAIRSHSGTMGEVVGIVGFCVVLTQDKDQLPKSLGNKYRKFVLVMSDGRTLDDIEYDSLQNHFKGNVIRWAVKRQRRKHKEVVDRLKRANAELRKLRAKSKAMKPGLEDLETLTGMYPREKVTIWGRTEYI